MKKSLNALTNETTIPYRETQAKTSSEKLRVSVFGLGYVGITTAACFAKEGHQLIGVDVLASKIEMIRRGESPIIEDEIPDLVREAVSSGQLKVIENAKEAVCNSEIGIVCVGTPSRQNGTLDHSYIRKSIEQIGKALKEHEEYFLVVVRSTVTPGTIENIVIPTLEQFSGRKVGDGYDVVFHPEFLREGSSVYDFFNPPKIVVGERVPGTADRLFDLYPEKFQAPRIRCSLEEAEMVKYCDNLFHAVKITFANEIGQYCHAIGVDSQKVMDIFTQDVKLNISSKYLRPGFAFGGSCLPKDLRAFLSVAKSKDLQLNMLENVLASNKLQIERALNMTLSFQEQRIGMYGLSFKAGTDDLRESPLVELAERLIGKGKQLLIYDKNVEISRLIGSNKSYVERHLPHLSALLTDDAASLTACPLIVAGHAADPEIIKGWLKAGIKVFDLTGNLDFAGHPHFTSII